MLPTFSYTRSCDANGHCGCADGGASAGSDDQKQPSTEKVRGLDQSARRGAPLFAARPLLLLLKAAAAAETRGVDVAEDDPALCAHGCCSAFCNAATRTVLGDGIVRSDASTSHNVEAFARSSAPIIHHMPSLVACCRRSYLVIGCKLPMV